MGAATRHLDTVRRQGFEVHLTPAGRLQVRPSSQLTDRQREYIRAHRDALIQELVHTAPEHLPGRSLVTIYRVEVDDATLVVIDPLNQAPHEFAAAQERRFGSDRVHNIERLTAGGHRKCQNN